MCAALSTEAAANFISHEKGALCEKHYYALLQGRLKSPVLVKNALLCDNRKKTRVLAREGERHTRFLPLMHVQVSSFPCFGKGGNEIMTIARCMIRSGQRHQIRAHAGWLGHPLAGDTLYGSDIQGYFMLEHWLLEFPGHIFRLPVELSIFNRIFGKSAQAKEFCRD